jgi:hypothetical protein
MSSQQYSSDSEDVVRSACDILLIPYSSEWDRACFKYIDKGHGWDYEVSVWNSDTDRNIRGRVILSPSGEWSVMDMIEKM